MLYVPLDFNKNLRVDALVDSGAYVSAIAQNDLDKIKQKPRNYNLKIYDPPSFRKQIANGQLEKALATATPKFEEGDFLFAEHFDVMTKLTGPLLGVAFYGEQQCSH